jgi:ribonuclease HI
MGKYKEKHVVVEPHIVCEVEDQIGKRFLFRLKVKWTDKQSKISLESLENVGVWTVKDDKIDLKLHPYRELKMGDELITHQFAITNVSEIPQSLKRELSPEIIEELSDKTKYKISEKDQIQKEDYYLSIHGTAGQDLLNKLNLTKKGEIYPALKIQSSKFGDIIYGISKTVSLSHEEVKKRKKLAQANATYVSFQTLMSDPDPYLPEKDELFFPSWMLSTTGQEEVSTLDLNATIKHYLEQQIEEFTEWDLKTEDYEKEIMDRFKRTRTRTADGRYVTLLPWNEKTANVSENREIALDRLKSLEKNFKKDPAAYGRYKEAIDQMVEAKVIIKVDEDHVMKCNKAVFFPHHAVYKPDRETTKTRVVWDGGAHEGNKNSINQCLESGPNLLPPLQCLLMRSRQGKYLCTADLKKAFFQVALSDKDIIQLFMYWLEEIPDKPGEYKIVIYQFVRLPWGLNCSPFILQAAIRCHGEDIIANLKDEDKIEKIKDILISLYIDDLIKTFNDPEDIKKVLELAFEVLQSGGWEVSKIRSNCEEINKKYNIDPNTGEGLKLFAHKVLGLLYDGEKDTFRPNLANVEKMNLSQPFTRRRALSSLAQFYDPMKLLAPWILTGQVLFQETQRTEKSWDKILKPDLQNKWQKYINSYKLLESYCVPREIVPYRSDFTVHIFSDASKTGYAAVAYVLWHERKESNMLTAMTKIVPDAMKGETTSNRLELMSGGLAIKLKRKIDNSFPGVKIDYTYWMDSMVALWWIYSRKVPFKIFISNRVESILEHSDRTQWRHVAGKENPADIASRGAEAEKFLEEKNLKLWKFGPDWLLHKEQWPDHPHEPVPMSPDQISQYQKEVNTKNSASLHYLPAHVLIFEKHFKPLLYVPKQFPILALSTVHVARWIGRATNGPMNNIYMAYIRNKPLMKQNQEHHWAKWKEGLRIYNLKKWADSMNIPNRTEKDNITFMSRFEYTQLNPPPARRSQVDPEEYDIAKNFLIRETQAYHLSGIYQALKNEVPQDMNQNDSKIVNKYQVRFDQSDQLLKVHGRIISEETEREIEEPSLEQVVNAYFTKVKRDRNSDYQLKTRSQTKPERDQAKEADELLKREEANKKEDTERVELEGNQVFPDPDLTPEEQQLVKEFIDLTEKDHFEGSLKIPNLLKSAHHFEELKLLPDQGIVAESLVRQAHIDCGHGGIHQTMRKLREEYWILHPTKIYNLVKKSCFICRFFTNKLWLIQEGNLPKQSKKVSYPFEYVGIDIAGPLFKVTPLKKIRKGNKIMEVETISDDHEIKATYYALLIVCANTRAVDIQLMTRMSAEAVAAAFETFIHARGKPKYVLSDNAGCFQSVNNAYFDTVSLQLEKKFTGIKWRFIPARAAWWGGQYEIFVRLMKTTLFKICPNLRVHSQLAAYQLLKQIEYCINTRPLYALSNDVNDLQVLTPFKFIRVGPELDEKYDPMDPNLTKEAAIRMKISQSKQVKELWFQLQQEYLNTQRSYHDLRQGYNQPPPKVGDLVLIKVDRKARNFWPIARITELLPNKTNGIIRKVRLQKYCPYEINSQLKKKKFPGVPESKLNADQLRELRGYFKDQRYTYDLRNLVPFELWKGEAEVNEKPIGTVNLLSHVGYLSLGPKVQPIDMFSLCMKTKLSRASHDFSFPSAEALGVFTFIDPPLQRWINSDQFDNQISVANSSYLSLYGHLDK